MYQHQCLAGSSSDTAQSSVSDLPVGKVVCVGRNYAAHAHELNNPVPSEPVLFIKPATALCAFSPTFTIPEKDCHYEAELAILIGSRLQHASQAQALAATAGVGLALDLTKRALQAKLKEKSLPWELAKSFDGACPITPFVSPEALSAPLAQLEYRLFIDNELRQQGRSQEMLTPSIDLIAHISQHFTLMPGDIVLTGTPKGVGELHGGQALRLELDQRFSFEARVI